MTSAHGSGVRGSRSPSRSGFSVTPAPPVYPLLCPLYRSPKAIGGLVDGLDRVPAELVAERGVHLRGERLVLARGEAGEERERDRRRGHGLVDRLEDRPAAFARVLDVAADLLQVLVLLEREHEQVEEPAADDGAVLPERRDLVQVRAELRGLHDLEPLGDRLHHPVLDPVVDHLHEVARA